MIRAMSQDDSLSPDAFAALQARFQQQSRKAQAYYTVMHEAGKILGGDAAADAWVALLDIPRERGEARGVRAGAGFVALGGYPTDAQGRLPALPRRSTTSCTCS